MSATTTAPARPLTPPAAERQAASPRRRWWGAILNGIPNLVVFSMLGGVLYFGHHTGWKMPKMSELTGTAGVAVDDWCEEHLVPESQCIECRLELYPKSKSFGFCWEHGVAECVIHHPELAQVKGQPQLPGYDTAQAIALIGRPENNSRDALHTRRVQFTSAESIAKSGIEVDLVQERPMTDAVTANGELTFDPNRVAHLSTRVPGMTALVLKGVGDEVQPGEVLAVVDAAQVGQIKSQLLEAIVQVQLRKATADQLRPIAASGAVPPKSLLEAESALQEAEIALITARQGLANLGFEVPDQLESADAKQVADDLRFLGISSSLVAMLPAGTRTASLIPIRAPYSGVVVDAEIVAGEVVEISRVLFTVADPSRMWLLLNVRQEDAKHVSRGLPVKFLTDDDRREVAGTVSWISPAVDERTRTLQARVAVANPDGRLRDKTYGTGRIILREEPNALVVPREAVQSTPDANFVFVRDKNYFDEDSPKFFHVRQVRIGAKDDQYVELLAGALPGEVVATKGSNVLLAQLLRSNLGAGCGCHEH